MRLTKPAVCVYKTFVKKKNWLSHVREIVKAHAVHSSIYDFRFQCICENIPLCSYRLRIFLYKCCGGEKDQRGEQNKTTKNNADKKKHQQKKKLVENLTN